MTTQLERDEWKRRHSLGYKIKNFMNTDLTSGLIQFYDLNIRIPSLEAEAGRLMEEKSQLWKFVTQNNYCENCEATFLEKSNEMTYNALALNQKAQELREKYKTQYDKTQTKDAYAKTRQDMD